MNIILAPKTTLSNKNYIGPEASLFIDRVKSSLLSIECADYFKIKIKKGEGREVVTRLQYDLQILLNKLENTDLWTIERLANDDHKDRFDLFYEIKLDGFNYSVIIELDACRADQVAKKFVSRTSHTIEKPTIYFAFCYPGTKHMAFAECVKYMAYCDSISDNLSSSEIPREFVGILIEKKFKTKRKANSKKKKIAIVTEATIL